MKINRNELITAFSFLLDYLKAGKIENYSNYSVRLCYISMRIGGALELSGDELSDLCAYSLLYDVDALLTGVAVPEWLRLIREKGEPLFSQIAALSATVAQAFAAGEDWTELALRAREFVEYAFHTTMRDAFMSAAGDVDFWLSLGDGFIKSELGKYLKIKETGLELSQLLPVTELYCRIVDKESPYTEAHSLGVSEKAARMSDYYCFNERTKDKLVIAAHLHDIGMLAIPAGITGKRGKLTEMEFRAVKAHPYYAGKAIGAVKGLEDVASWASCHHEAPNGSGYPRHLSEPALSFESQLIACLDVYQALSEDRPYRKKYSKRAARAVMEEMAYNGKLNGEIVRDIFNQN